MAKQKKLSFKRKIKGVTFTITANKNYGICDMQPRIARCEVFSHMQGCDIRLYGRQTFDMIEEFFENRNK